MKKYLITLLCVLLLMLTMGAAYAVTIPDDKITVTARAVDYVSAMAGIAKPVSTPPSANARVAILVHIDVPAWYDVTNMTVVPGPEGIALDNTSGLAVATGDYLLFGTLYDPAGKLTITLKDNAIASATTNRDLWAAIYGDRTASATVNFSTAIYTALTKSSVEIPKTGDNPIAIAVFVPLGILAFAMADSNIWRRRGIDGIRRRR